MMEPERSCLLNALPLPLPLPLLLFSWCLQTIAAQLPAPPQNVHLVTLNTDYTLTWDWDHGATEARSVSFTAECLAKYKLNSKRSYKWSPACEKTSQRSCNLEKCNMHYLGIYMLRVQANVGTNHSDWVLKEFCPDKDAAVGPPASVHLAAAGSNLDVHISDPLTRTNASMRTILYDLYYHILYWERTDDTKTPTPSSLTSKANLVTLPKLKARTWYCVVVQSCCSFYNKSSSFTEPRCLQTEGPTPWWQIFAIFLGSLFIVFLAVSLALLVLYWCYRTMKATLTPPISIPTHFQQYLQDSPMSDTPGLLSLDSEAELLCDQVTVCPEPAPLEIHSAPPEAQLAPPSFQDPEQRLLRKDSRGSGDSGIYSTEGSSGLRQPGSSGQSSWQPGSSGQSSWQPGSSGQSSWQPGSSGQSSWQPDSGQSSWLGPADLEQVKMRDMDRELKTGRAIADEGIVDVCV